MKLGYPINAIFIAYVLAFIAIFPAEVRAFNTLALTSRRQYTTKLPKTIDWSPRMSSSALLALKSTSRTINSNYVGPIPILRFLFDGVLDCITSLFPFWVLAATLFGYVQPSVFAQHMQYGMTVHMDTF
jgi:hypothetical protein